MSPFLVGQSTSSVLIGTVFAENGKPISGVGIYGDRAKGHTGTTNSNGSFALHVSPSGILHFWKKGFRPKTMVFKATKAPLKIVLLREATPIWRLSTCSSTESREVPLPMIPTFFLVPADAKIENFRDVDYGKAFITLNDNSKPLEVWWGIILKPEVREQILISDSSVVEERWIYKVNGKDTFGTDIRGQTAGEKRWRYADFPIGFAIYEDVSADTARVYDRIIDSACLPAR